LSISTTCRRRQRSEASAAVLQQEDAQMDEADRNLWNAHQDLLNTGTNPAIPIDSRSETSLPLALNPRIRPGNGLIL
jgi:hypothetical protein